MSFGRIFRGSYLRKKDDYGENHPIALSISIGRTIWEAYRRNDVCGSNLGKKHLQSLINAEVTSTGRNLGSCSDHRFVPVSQTGSTHRIKAKCRDPLAFAPAALLDRRDPRMAKPINPAAVRSNGAGSGVVVTGASSID
jgi:hypothetical protein